MGKQTTDKSKDYMNHLLIAITWLFPLLVIMDCFLFQVGISFLAGLGFALLLVPVNRWLAEKIQNLSKEMMEQKDNRVKVKKITN